MVAAVVDRFGTIDIVHNNAAALGLDVIGRDVGVVDMDTSVWDRTMAVTCVARCSCASTRSP
jgi:NAD(P)-dependent dehydrogenase (short-subunit alcohol dehydrogenase family)